MKRLLIIGAVLAVPALAFAQTTSSITSLFTLVLNFINLILVPLIFAVAFVFFLFGVYRYFIAGGGNQEKVQEGQKFVMWSIVGFVLMISVWGIINLFVNTLGFAGASMPCIPTFGSGCGGTTGAITGTSGSLFGNIGNLFGGTSSTGGTSAFGTGTTSATPTTVYYNPATGTYSLTQTAGSTPVPFNQLPAGTNVTGYGQVQGNVGNGSAGSSCTSNTQCNGTDTVCNFAAGAGNGVCAADGPNTVSCQDDSTLTYAGTCANGQPPTNQSGDVVPGSVGSECNGNNGNCNGNLVCNDSTDTCAADSASTYSCPDNNAPNNEDLCSNGQPPTNSLGNQAPADGSVPQGGSCAGNEDACASGTCDNDGICADSNANGSTDNSNGYTKCDVGEVAPGLSCVQCSDGSSADTSADCPSNSGGYTGSNNDTGDGNNVINYCCADGTSYNGSYCDDDSQPTQC